MIKRALIATIITATSAFAEEEIGWSMHGPQITYGVANSNSYVTLACEPKGRVKVYLFDIPDNGFTKMTKKAPYTILFRIDDSAVPVNGTVDYDEDTEEYVFEAVVAKSGQLLTVLERAEGPISFDAKNGGFDGSVPTTGLSLLVKRLVQRCK